MVRSARGRPGDGTIIQRGKSGTVLHRHGRMLERVCIQQTEATLQRSKAPTQSLIQQMLPLANSVVQSGAALVIKAGVTLTLSHGTSGTDVLILGTFTNNGTLSQGGTVTASVSSGGMYIHNTNNSANLKATWDPNSTCQFTGVTTALPANLAQTFGHFAWNCASQTAILSIAGVLTTIAGNFRITSTGTGELDLAATQSQTTTVGGNYTQTGGTFGLSTGNGTPTLSIAGNDTITGGTLRMKGPATAGNYSGVSTMNVGGNFYFTAGTISRKSTNTGGKGLIVFNGTGVQTYTSGGTIATTDSIGFTVNSGATLYTGTRYHCRRGNIYTFQRCNARHRFDWRNRNEWRHGKYPNHWKVVQCRRTLHLQWNHSPKYRKRPPQYCQSADDQ